MATARYFDSEKDNGGDFPGVPKADLDEQTFNGYPDYLKASIDASPMYRKTPVRHERPADKKDGE